jgi:hypothetical protein
MPKRSPGDAHIILDNLIERSGIPRETQPEWIDFIHNTTKEYLAGDRFANDNDAGLLAKHLNESDWKQVVLFVGRLANAVLLQMSSDGPKTIRRAMLRVSDQDRSSLFSVVRSLLDLDPAAKA